jgi:electron transfer flavoprotein alpha/beta subunit
MKRRELEAHLLTLETTAPILASATRTLSRDQLRRPSERTGRSFIEEIAHLAETESQQFGVWIARLQAEDAPVLPDLTEPEGRPDGDRTLDGALERFRTARARNVERLLAVGRGDWKRSGRTASGERVRLEEVPAMMAEHDRRHTIEIAMLLEEIKNRSTVCGAPAGVRLAPCAGV